MIKSTKWESIVNSEQEAPQLSWDGEGWYWERIRNVKSFNKKEEQMEMILLNSHGKNVTAAYEVKAWKRA